MDSHSLQTQAASLYTWGAALLFPNKWSTDNSLQLIGIIFTTIAGILAWHVGHRLAKIEEEKLKPIIRLNVTRIFFEKSTKGYSCWISLKFSNNSTGPIFIYKIVPSFPTRFSRLPDVKNKLVKSKYLSVLKHVNPKSFIYIEEPIFFDYKKSLVTRLQHLNYWLQDGADYLSIQGISTKSLKIVYDELKSALSNKPFHEEGYPLNLEVQTSAGNFVLKCVISLLNKGN